LPWKPNASKTDKVAQSVENLFESDRVSIEEKVDGSNCGMGILDDVPIIRNRNHVIHKGFNGKTPAKMQFSSVWNWWHSNAENFQKLDEFGPFSVFGEWCIAQISMEYTKLPSWFLAHTLYDYDARKYVDTAVARDILTKSGFDLVPLLYWGKVPNFQFIESLKKASEFSDEPAEGVYLKICDGKYITKSFKMVRQGFEPGKLWSDKTLKKNRLKK
jgi:hypothetical protein